MSRTTIDTTLHKDDVSRLRPNQDFVLMKVIEREKSKGGIYFSPTGSTATECLFGEVMALGSGLRNDYDGYIFPFELEVGDIVLIMRYMGEIMHVDGQEYRFVRNHGIWGVAKGFDPETYDCEDLIPRMGMVLVRPEDNSMTRSGTLYLANEELQNSDSRGGEILSVGPGVWNSRCRKRTPLCWIAGERIMFMRYAGADVFIKGEKLRLIDSEDIRFSYEGEL
jgi:chaperonin GroES